MTVCHSCGSQWLALHPPQPTFLGLANPTLQGSNISSFGCPFQSASSPKYYWDGIPAGKAVYPCTVGDNVEGPPCHSLQSICVILHWCCERCIIKEDDRGQVILYKLFILFVKGDTAGNTKLRSQYNNSGNSKIRCPCNLCKCPSSTSFKYNLSEGATGSADLTWTGHWWICICVPA